MKMKCTLLSKLLLLAIFFSCSLQISVAQERIKKIVFQGFWWDYWNENYRFGWANYLAELAPRLKAAGFNAVWIPPAYKNEDPGFVGYMPFDNYDLGDKRQKGNGHPLNHRLRTRVGSKDDLLRLAAVLHANGIEMVHDIVLNHNGGAGGGVLTNGASGPAGQAGAGGQDNITSGSTNTAAGFKNFRYVSYSTPALDETQNDYWTRNGRWAKNAPNFYNCNSFCNDITNTFWGPDMNYEAWGVGQSGNIPTSGSVFVNGNNRAYFNPTQGSNYMLNNARDWLVWLKKQTGADGFRWDAVKHFPYGGGSVPGVNAQENIIFATKYNAGFANGGQNMLNIGEWVGGAGELDSYLNMIRTGSAPGGVSNEINTGTFDFALRGFNGLNGVFGLITGGGNYNMANLPGSQQNIRVMDYPGGKRVHRTVPFINNHDTYRPILASNGNFSQPLGNSSGWNTSSQLATNVDPREPRIAAGYAAICAVDGNPQIFFEDLFNNWGTGMRYTHLPTSTTELPANGDIINILQAHQALGFKDGDYGVPTASNSPFFQTGNAQDHIVFERVGKALIGVTDVFSAVSNNSSDQQVFCKVNDAWPVGTVLYDYSGAHGIQTVTIPADRRVLIQTAPSGHTIANAFGRGYSIWAPAPTNTTINSVQDLYNILAAYQQPLNTSTTQEWELADDLGDSHCESLGYGGALPANSTNQRVVGKIFVEAGKAITYQVTPEINNTNIVCWLSNLNGTRLHSINGGASLSTPLSGSFTPTTTGWVVVKIRQGTNTQATQKAWVNINYTAPAVVNTRAAENNVASRVAVWTSNKGSNNVTDCGNWEEGRTPADSVNLLIPANASTSPNFATSLTVKDLLIEQGATLTLPAGVTLTVRGSLLNEGTINGDGTVIVSNTNAAQIRGVYNNLTINTTNTVTLYGAVIINNNLTLTNGIINTNGHILVEQTGATISGGNATSYIQLNGAGMLRQFVGSTATIYPVGNANYTPITVSNSGTVGSVDIISTDDVLSNGTTGSTISTNQRVNKTWTIAGATGTNITITELQWNAANEAVGFNRSNAYVARSSNATVFTAATSVLSVNGSNPYNIPPSISIGNTTTSIAILSDNTILPVVWGNFNYQLQAASVSLIWNTLNETNNKGFYVERSLNGIDFSSIGFVAAKTSGANNYNFETNTINGTVYYRLKQIDNDGQFTYSKTLAINNTAVTANLVTVSPNPVTQFLVLQPTNANAVNAIYNVEVLSITGKRIAIANGSLSTVNSLLKNSLANQPNGNYLLNVHVGNDNQQIKITKL